MKPILGCLFLCVAATLSAATADLRVTISGAPSRIQRAGTIAWSASVENLGPDAAHDVRFESRLFLGAECVSETLAVLDAGAKHTVACSEPNALRYLDQIQASAYAAEGDPDPSNNNVFQYVDVVTAPDLAVTLSVAPTVDVGLPFPLHVAASNFARTTATGVVLTIDVTGGQVLDASSGCSVAGNRVTCDLGTITPWADPNQAEVRNIVVNVRAPEASRAPVSFEAAIHGNEADASPQSNDGTASTQTYETFLVTTTADSGSGSLRAAIEAANASCSQPAPCKIAFRIPPSDAPWLTIRPASPLPAIAADTITVDGTTQPRYFGDTNPDGPEIEINGAAAGAADGLTVDAGCSASVRALVINGFAGAGLMLRGAGCSTNPFRNVSESYIGTDPTGTRAVPNGRGIIIDTQRWPFTIQQNVISGNARSGVFVANGANTVVLRNVIGLTAKKDAGLGNGASGVYLGAGAHGSDVEENFIGFNHDSGVSLDRDAIQVSFYGNSFQANWQLAVDYGLDGPSSSVPVVSDRPSGTLHTPVITSARYDAATDTTIVSGNVLLEKMPTSFASAIVTLYASDAAGTNGYGQGQYVLGNANVGSDGNFTFTRPGRPPGPWIAATATSYEVWGFVTIGDNAGGGGYATTTTEFSRAERIAG